MSTFSAVQDRDAESLTHWPAISAGALVTAGLASAVGLLWTAVAFSSHEGWAYNHLDVWLGATLIGAALIGGLLSGVVSNRRGWASGGVNGAAAGAVVVVAAGALALVALAVNGSLDSTLQYGTTTATVHFLRPYVAFWAAGGALFASVLGGAGGGLVPRRPAHAPVVELAPLAAVPAPSVLNGANREAVGL